MEKTLYLKSDVYFEPLFNNWYMWPYLLAPVPAAMNLANHHLRLMKSFVANAKLHATAAKHSAMTGSSFVDCNEQQVGDIAALIAKSQTEYSDLIQFAKAIKELDEILREKANGTSLEPLYNEIPDCLRGLVELVYDLNNQPSIRFIEGMIYQSSVFKNQAQSVCLGNAHSEKRPFVLSTPRLTDENHLHIAIPLTHPFVEALFKMREQPGNLVHLKALLGDGNITGQLDFASLFTEEVPTIPAPYASEDVRIRYLGHAGILVETREVSLMIDPVIAYKNDEHNDKVTYEDLPPHIDFVMVTHAHMDHTCIETLLQLKHKTGHILVPKNSGGSLADPSLKLMLKSIGFQRVLEMDEMESLNINDGYVMSLPFLGEHADVNVRSKTAWYINVKGRKIISAADSSNLDPILYERLHQIIGDVDVLFIGMECTGGPLRWLYGPLLTQSISKEANESRRFNGSGFDAAAGLVDKFNPQQVYVYALGMEPWYRYFMGISYNDDDEQMVASGQLVDKCRTENRVAERLFGCKTLLLEAAATQKNSSTFSVTIADPIAAA